MAIEITTCPNEACHGALVRRENIRWDDDRMNAQFICETCGIKVFVPL